MKKNGNRNRMKNAKNFRFGGYPAWIVGVLISCCLLGTVLARYVYQTTTDPGQITSEYFYFTADILGDTTMVPLESSAEESYSFTDKSTEGTWYLYGASEHNIKIQVQNYFDDLRIDSREIQFTGNVSVQDENGNALSPGNLFPALKLNNTVFSSGNFPGDGGKHTAEIVLNIPSYTNWNYTDGTVVTAKIESNAPYKKTLTMKFILYATDSSLKYEVVDSVGSPYAELIVMTNADNNVQPYIEWPKELSIDNTNPLTFTYSNGTFTQQEGIEARNMQVSEKLQTGRSESIYFFKKDPSKDYSKNKTSVSPTSEEKYVIRIENP